MSPFPKLSCAASNPLYYTIPFFVVVLLSHFGAKSPYSYGWAVLNLDIHRHLDGFAVNADTHKAVSLVRFFYKPYPLDISSSPTIWLPIYSFLASVFVALVRSYVLGHYILNVSVLILLFAAIQRILLRRGLKRSTVFASIAALSSLPIFPHYIGQPAQYIVGPVINILLILAIVELADHPVRSPWMYGLLLAVFTLNYDFAVFLCGALAFLYWQNPFGRSLRPWLIVLLLPPATLTLWSLLIHVGFEATPNSEYAYAFLRPILMGWRDILTDPYAGPIGPFVNGYIGLVVAAKQMLVQVYWPVLLLTLGFLLTSDKIFRFARTAYFRMAMSLLGAYLLEQWSVASYDWELNPRRALPVLFTFGASLVFVIEHRITGAWRRWILWGMCLFSVFMCFSDVILKNPAVQMLLLGQNIRSDPRYVLPMVKLRLTPDDLPLLPSDQRYAIGTVERFGWDSEWAVHFLVAQLIMLLAVAALVWGMRRAQLVSRNTALALAGLYLASWVTRLV